MYTVSEAKPIRAFFVSENLCGVFKLTYIYDKKTIREIALKEYNNTIAS